MRIFLIGILLTLTTAVVAQAAPIPAVSAACGPCAVQLNLQSAPVDTAPAEAQPQLGSYLLADKDNFEDKVKDTLGLTKSKPVHSRRHHRRHRHHRKHHAKRRHKVHHVAPPAKPRAH